MPTNHLYYPTANSVEREHYVLTLTVCIPVTRPRSLGKDRGYMGHSRIMGTDEDSMTELCTRIWWDITEWWASSWYGAVMLQPTHMWSLRFIHLFRGCSQHEATAGFITQCTVYLTKQVTKKNAYFLLTFRQYVILQWGFTKVYHPNVQSKWEKETIKGALQWFTHIKLRDLQKIKTALTQYFILTMYQMSICSVKGVARSNTPTENCYPTLQLPLALHSILAFICLLF